MFIRFQLVLMIFILSGCAASPYIPTSNMLQIKQGMNKESAMLVFSKYTKQLDGRGSFCYSKSIRFDKGAQLLVASDGYSLRAYRVGEFISSEKVGSLTRNTYRKDYYKAERKYAEMTKIRVIAKGQFSPDCEDASRFEYELGLHYSTADYDTIGVVKNGLDEVLAALLTLAPQTRFIQGGGI